MTDPEYLLKVWRFLKNIPPYGPNIEDSIWSFYKGDKLFHYIIFNLFGIWITFILDYFKGLLFLGNWYIIIVILLLLSLLLLLLKHYYHFCAITILIFLKISIYWRINFQCYFFVKTSLLIHNTNQVNKFY